jgi:hypothetical protein
VNTRTQTYTAYSIGCAVVWAVIRTVTATVASKDRKHTTYLVAGGWAIGWLSATIARSVYPRAQDSPKQVLGQIHLQPRQLTIADVPGLGAPLA